MTVTENAIALDGVRFRGRSAPRFAQFLVRVGAHAAELASRGASAHIALLLPTESYAAVFVALGAAAMRSELEPTSLGEDAKRHFEMIKALPIGASVWHLGNGRKYKALYEGNEVGADGVERLVVNRGGITYKLPIDSALDVVPAGDARWDELPNASIGLKLKGSPELVRAVYGSEVNAVLISPRTEALVVGRKDTILGELEIPVSTDDGEGQLKDLVRVREGGFKHSYRVRWMSAKSLDLADDSVREHRPVVVLNGATNHLGAHHRVLDGVSVSVIGSSEPAALEACEEMQATVLMGTHRAAALPMGIEIPPGVSTFAMEGRL